MSAPTMSPRSLRFIIMTLLVMVFSIFLLFSPHHGHLKIVAFIYVLYMVGEGVGWYIAVDKP